MKEMNPENNSPVEPKSPESSATKRGFRDLREWVAQHKLIVTASICIPSLAALGILLYPYIIDWRIRSLAATAEQQAEAKDWVAAWSTARAAYLLNRDKPEVLRPFAKILTLSGDPMNLERALEFWDPLLKSPAATMDDRRSYIESYRGTQSVVSKVDEQLRFLMEKEPNSSRNWLLSAKVNEANGDAAKMLLCARRAHELDPKDSDATLYLASQLLRLPNSHSEGFELLWSLVAESGKNNLAACAMAAKQNDLTDAQMGELIQHLKNDPQATVAHKLAALELEIRKKPEQTESLLNAAVKVYREAGGDSLREFGVWLNIHGASSMTLAAIPADVAKSNRGLFRVYLDALMAMKKWAEVDAAVSERGVPIEASMMELLRATAATELGNKDDAIVHWRSAQAAAVGSPEQAQYVASYARRFGRDVQAESIYRSLTMGNPTIAEEAYRKLLEMASANGTSAIRKILGEMLVRWPKNTAVQNDYAYFSILLNEDVEQNRDLAIQLVNQFPSYLSHRSTLALAFLRLNKPDSALDIYKGLDVKWELAPTRFRAVYVAVLLANGKKEEALNMMTGIRLDSLQPEEQQLIKF